MARNDIHGNTALEMKNRGDWNKIAKKHYHNINGIEVLYDCNVFGWRIKDGEKITNYHWSALWVAIYEVDHNTFSRWFK